MHAHRPNVRPRRLTLPSTAVFSALTIAALVALAPARATATGQTTADPAGAEAAAPTPAKTKITMDDFLDRLMIAESAGRDDAKNPLSTATGAFQFIESTFLAVMQRHYLKRIEKLNTAQILALRTDRKTARDAARAYTRDNAQILATNGHKPTFPHLRLAFLLGANGAMRILEAKPETPLAPLLGSGVMRANPFMTRLTAGGLIARAARDISLDPDALVSLEPIRDPKTGQIIIPARTADGPRIRVRCNLSRPSCRRWLSLKKRRLAGSKR